VFPIGGKRFPSSSLQSGCRAHSRPHSMLLGALFLIHGTDHLLSPSTEINNECSQDRIYARAKGSRVQGGKFPGAAYLKKSRLKLVCGQKEAVHEREI
jgi:hypothetical protein